ncbi:MAG: cache domain-containing protein [Desulfomonile tiedjei]|nr:cache domain-containing protein [Desulfomonile tiedjei]
MKKQESSRGGRNLRSTISVFCIAVAMMLSATVPGFCQGQKTGITLTATDKAAMRGLCAIAEGVSNALNVYMDARVTELLVGSSLSETLREALATPGTRVNASKTLEAWRKASGAYEAILLLDITGLCLASAPTGLVDRDFASDPAFQTAIGGKPAFSDFHKSDVLTSLDPKSKGWTITIAVPMKADNKVEGVLMSFLQWSRLSELIMRVPVGKTG